MGQGLAVNLAVLNQSPSPELPLDFNRGTALDIHELRSSRVSRMLWPIKLVASSSIVERKTESPDVFESTPVGGGRVMMRT